MKSPDPVCDGSKQLDILFSKTFFEEKNTFINTITNYIQIIFRSGDAFMYFYKRKKTQENALSNSLSAVKLKKIKAYKIRVN